MTDSTTTQLTIRRGDCVDVSFEYLDAEETPIDLTGFGIEFSLLLNRDKGTRARPIYLTDESGGLTVTPAAGRIAIHIDAAWTTNFERGAKGGTYGIRLTDPSGHVSTMLSGGVTLLSSAIES